MGAGAFSFEEVDWAFEDSEYLEVDGGQIAIALGALVRAVQGHPGSLGPELDLSSFAARLTPARVGWVREGIERALAGPEASELFELWQETDEFEQWFQASRASLPDG